MTFILSDPFNYYTSHDIDEDVMKQHSLLSLYLAGMVLHLNSAPQPVLQVTQSFERYAMSV